MLQIGEVARTVLLVYQPTLLPGGTMTRPEGVSLPQALYTVYEGLCLHLVCKLGLVYTATKPQR